MKITIIIGPVCSGKTHLMNAQYQDAIRVDVGDIVREVTSDQARTFDKGLGGYIIMRLSKEIDDAFSTNSDIVIVGIRQLSILRTIEQKIKRMIYLTINVIKYERIYLDIEESIRRERYSKRAANKDRHYTFSEIELRDNALGLEELTSHCLWRDKSNTTIKTQ